MGQLRKGLLLRVSVHLGWYFYTRGKKVSTRIYGHVTDRPENGVFKGP